MISQVLITIFLSQQFFDKKVQQTFISNDTISKRLKLDVFIQLKVSIIQFYNNYNKLLFLFN